MAKEENEKSESVQKKTIKVQKVSQQENKVVVAGRRFDLLKERSNGFLQTLIIAWNGDSIVSSVNIHLDLGKHGTFTIEFNQYFEAGLVSSHLAQDFWVSKKDDTAKKYALILTPALPIEFNGLRLVLINKNSGSLTVSLAQLKFYVENSENNGE